MNELLQLLKKMDIPEYRKIKTTTQNLKWVYDNLHIRNSKNCKYQETMDRLKEQLILMNIKI